MKMIVEIILDNENNLYILDLGHRTQDIGLGHWIHDT